PRYSMNAHNHFKQILLTLVLFILPVSLAFGQSGTDVSHKHMLWKVTSPDGEVNYLTGSVHIMKPDIYPLDKVFRQTFKQADELVFELNFDSLKARQLQLVHKYAMLPEGTTLKDKVSPEVYQLLEAKM